MVAPAPAVTSGRRAGGGVPIEKLVVSTYTVPTDFPEADGTLEWDRTTMVLVEASAGDLRGLGYTYGSGACANLIAGTLARAVEGMDALAPEAAWSAMVRCVRNVGRPGIGSMSIA